MMATIEPWKMEYPLRKVRKPLADVTIRHGTMANASIRQTNCPRTMFRYLGRRQVTSAAKGIKLQAMDVPRVAKAKLADAKKTPALAAGLYPRSSMPLRRS